MEDPEAVAPACYHAQGFLYGYRREWPGGFTVEDDDLIHPVRWAFYGLIPFLLIANQSAAFR